MSYIMPHWQCRFSALFHSIRITLDFAHVYRLSSTTIEKSEECILLLFITHLLFSWICLLYHSPHSPESLMRIIRKSIAVASKTLTFHQKT